jgi:hypothetical protein
MFEPVKTLEDRLDNAMRNANPRMKQVDLAKQLGVDSQWVSKVKKGAFNGEKEMREAAKILGVSEDWLIHGTGPAPTWAPKPPPEQESLQKSMDLLLKMFAEQQAELKALRQEVQDLKPKSLPKPLVRDRDRPVMERPGSIPSSVV